MSQKVHIAMRVIFVVGEATEARNRALPEGFKRQGGDSGEVKQ